VCLHPGLNFLKNLAIILNNLDVFEIFMDIKSSVLALTPVYKDGFLYNSQKLKAIVHLFYSKCFVTFLLLSSVN